jgi:hypothetical protein
MSTETPARDFLLPRLNALLADAAVAGFGRDVSVAVLIDLVTGPGFNDVPLDPREDDPHGHEVAPVSITEVAVAEASVIPPDSPGHSPLRRRALTADPAPP